MSSSAFVGQFWKMIVGGIAAVSVLVGAIAWANSVHNTAVSALALSEENKADIRGLREQLNTQTNSLTELRVDIKYLITSVNELKAQKR